MRRVALSLAALLAAPAAWAQLVPFNFVSRNGSPRGVTTLAARINRVDCAAGETITVSVTLPSPAVGVPELWVSETVQCDPTMREPLLGATCFPICGAAVRRSCTIPYADGEREYTFTVPVRWIIDPRTGMCSAVAGRRYLQLLSNSEVVARSSPSMRVDLVAPQAPLSVVATLGGVEESAVVTWTYATPDAGTVVVDSGSTDVIDASTDVAEAGTDAGVDVVDVVDVPVDSGGPSADPEVETVSQFYVLCDPAPGTNPMTPIDGGVCPSNPFASLDVTDDAQLQRLRCTRADLTSAARNVTLDGLPPGVPHRFGVVAEDLAGNRSAVTLSGDCATPRAVNDFWEEYRRQGGQAAPGACAVGLVGTRSTGAGGLALGLLGLGWALRRRRR